MNRRFAIGPSHIFPGAGAPPAPETLVAATVEVASAEPVAAEPTKVAWDATMKKAELLAIATAKGLSVTAASTKAEIVAALGASD
jgi:hypothetical protein